MECYTWGERPIVCIGIPLTTILVVVTKEHVKAKHVIAKTHYITHYSNIRFIKFTYWHYVTISPH